MKDALYETRIKTAPRRGQPVVSGMALGLCISYIVAFPFRAPTSTVLVTDSSYVFFRIFTISAFLAALVFSSSNPRLLQCNRMNLICGLVVFLGEAAGLLAGPPLIRRIMQVISASAAAVVLAYFYEVFLSQRSPSIFIATVLVTVQSWLWVFDFVIPFTYGSIDNISIPFGFISVGVRILFSLFPFASAVILALLRKNTAGQIPAADITVHAGKQAFKTGYVLLCPIFLAFIYFQAGPSFNVYSPWITVPVYAVYFMALISLALYLARPRDIFYILGYSLSAAGLAFFLLVSTFGSEVLNIVSLFLFSLALAGVDMFYWLLVHACGQTKKHLLTAALVLSITFIDLSDLLLSLKINDMVKSNAFIVIPVIAMLFFLIPFVLRRNSRSSAGIYPEPPEGNVTERDAAFVRTPNSDIPMRLLNTDIADISAARKLSVLLTPTERRVLELLCKGYENIEISKSMYITTNTVKFHVRNILRKAGVKNRFTLMAKIKN